jgi:hypothetical protein
METSTPDRAVLAACAMRDRNGGAGAPRPSALSLLENGRREPKLSLIDSLATAAEPPPAVRDRAGGGVAQPAICRRSGPSFRPDAGLQLLTWFNWRKYLVDGTIEKFQRGWARWGTSSSSSRWTADSPRGSGPGSPWVARDPEFSEGEVPGLEDGEDYGVSCNPVSRSME